MRKIYISVLNFNNRENTIECLKSLQKVNFGNYEVNVVVEDNASSEALRITEKDFKDLNLKIIYNKENLGFSGGHNVGIKYALSKNADYIVILNNDILLDKNFLQELVETAEKKDAGIVCSKIYFAPGFEFHKGKYSEKELGKVFWYAGGLIDWANVIAKHRGVDEVDKGQYDVEEETDFATGCCMMVRANVFKKIGLLDDSYFLYYEDSDFSQRAKLSGFKIYYSPKSILWHKNAASAGGPGSPLQDYFITRNRLVFGIKYAPFRAKLALIRESIETVFKGRKFQRKGIIDFYLRRLGKGSYRLPK